MKTCTTCGLAKDPTQFHKNKGSVDGLSHKCKPCAIIHARKWAEENKDRVKQNHKRWREANKGYIKEKAAEYYAQNSEKITQKVEVWRKSNPEKHRIGVVVRRAKDPEKFNKYGRDWIKRNLMSINIKTALRRAARKNAAPAWADRKMMASFYTAAHAISKETGIKYHVDHIVPLTSHYVCGLHNEFNLQILTEKENISKGNRFWPDMP